MEYFIEGIAPLRYWYIKSNGQMRRVEYTKKFLWSLLTPKP